MRCAPSGPGAGPGAPRAGEHDQAAAGRALGTLRAAGTATGRAAADDAAWRAGALTEELTEAFQKGTWAFRHESRGTEMTAWRRAAAFLNGGVFGGGPPE